MDNTYSDLIHQTFNFPQEGFDVKDNELYFNDIPLMGIIKQYGTPLKISYLPKISSQIQKAKRLLLLHQKFSLFVCSRRNLKERSAFGDFISV